MSASIAYHARTRASSCGSITTDPGLAPLPTISIMPWSTSTSRHRSPPVRSPPNIPTINKVRSRCYERSSPSTVPNSAAIWVRRELCDRTLIWNRRQLERLPRRVRRALQTRTVPTAASVKALHTMPKSSRFGPADRSNDSPPAADSSTSTAKQPEPRQPRQTQQRLGQLRRARSPIHTRRRQRRRCSPNIRTRFRHPHAATGAYGGYSGWWDRCPSEATWRSVTRVSTHSTTAAVGTPAPRFALPNSRGTNIPLDDLLANGPVVLVFLRGFA